MTCRLTKYPPLKNCRHWVVEVGLGYFEVNYSPNGCCQKIDVGFGQLESSHLHCQTLSRQESGSDPAKLQIV